MVSQRWEGQSLCSASVLQRACSEHSLERCTSHVTGLVPALSHWVCERTEVEDDGLEYQRKETGKTGPRASVSLTCLHPMFLAIHAPPPPAVPTLRALVGVGVCRMGGDLRDPVTQSYGIPSDMQPDPGETLPSGRVPVPMLRAGEHHLPVGCQPTLYTAPWDAASWRRIPRASEGREVHSGLKSRA